MLKNKRNRSYSSAELPSLTHRYDYYVDWIKNGDDILLVAVRYMNSDETLKVAFNTELTQEEVRNYTYANFRSRPRPWFTDTDFMIPGLPLHELYWQWISTEHNSAQRISLEAARRELSKGSNTLYTSNLETVGFLPRLLPGVIYDNVKVLNTLTITEIIPWYWAPEQYSATEINNATQAVMSVSLRLKKIIEQFDVNLIRSLEAWKEFKRTVTGL